jgi:hypothetical protein
MEERKTQIAPNPFQLRYVPEIRGRDADLIFEYFMVFSRLEFALKQAGFRRIASDQHVEPDWNAFSSRYQSKFVADKYPELKEAFYYYLIKPPKVQIVENNKLCWKDRQQGKGSDFVWVINSIRVVRNNLFHGGKFPWDQLRDVSLLSYGLLILYECIELDDNIKNAFYFSPVTI